MIGYRLPRRIDDRSRPESSGGRARWAIPAAKPLVMVGLSASSTSSVSPASLALEHTSVDPATNVASNPNANPPIQKNGELQNSLSVGGQAADRVEVPLVAEQRGVGVHHSLRGAGRARRVDDGQRIRAVDIVFHRREQRPVDRLGQPVDSMSSDAGRAGRS